jgi:hypothetical protein
MDYGLIDETLSIPSIPGEIIPKSKLKKMLNNVFLIQFFERNVKEMKSKRIDI